MFRGVCVPEFWQCTTIDDLSQNSLVQSIITYSSSPIFETTIWYPPGHLIFQGVDTTNLYSFTANTGYYLAPTQFINLNDTALWAEDIADLNGYQTALSSNAVLQDTLTNPQNVLLDTVNKRVFIVCQHNLSSYSYSFGEVGVKHTGDQQLKISGGLRILPVPSGVAIIFPQTARHADLTFYDLSGRMVDRLTAMGSNAVLWRQKSHGSGCFIVHAKINGESYSAKFMAR